MGLFSTFQMRIIYHDAFSVLFVYAIVTYTTSFFVISGAAPYSPTQYDPAPAGLLSSHGDNVSTSNNNSNNNNNNTTTTTTTTTMVISNKVDDPNDNDYAIQDDEKPYDPEECDFEASEDSPPPPPPPPPPPATSVATAGSSSQKPSGIVIATAAATASQPPVSMGQIFDQIKMSTLSSGVTSVISAVSGQQSKPETKDLLAELTQRVGEKKTEVPLPKPSTAGLPTALQNLFSQVSKVSMTSNLTTNLGTGLTPAIPSTTSTVLSLNLPSVTTNVLTTTQPSTLGSIQLPLSSTIASSKKLTNSSFTVNTSASPLTTNAKDITTTTAPESSTLSKSLTIPVVKQDQALSSLMQGSNLPPISETGWSTIAQTLASLAKVQSTNLTSQVPPASSASATATTTLITTKTSSTTSSSVAGSANYSPSLTTTTTSADFKHITMPKSHKIAPNIPQKEVSSTRTSMTDVKLTTTSTYSVYKPPETGKISSVRIAFSTGPKHPLVPHAAFKEEEKPKMQSLLSEPKIPGLGLDDDEEEMGSTAPKDNAFLSRAEFDALSTIAKTDSFLAGGLRSDTFISNWKGINIGNKEGGNQTKVDDTKTIYETSKLANENQQQQQQQPPVLKVQAEGQAESSRGRSDTHYESSSSSSSTKTKPETSSKDVGKGRLDSRYDSSSSKSRESHHDSKTRLSHDQSKESRRRSDSDRKRSSSGHHSDSGSSSKSSRYSDRSDRHSHSRHSRSRDYSDKRDRDYRKDYSSSDHRSRDRDHERDRDRDYDHSSSKSKDRSADRKEHRRSSSSKSDDRSGNKKSLDKSDKFGTISNEDSNKYGDVDERKKVYGASSSYMDSAPRYTAEKKDISISSSHDGSKSYKSQSIKKDGDESFKSLQFPSQDQDFRKSLSHNVAPPSVAVVPPVPQPIPTLTSTSLEEFPSDVDHRKHGISWPAIYDHKSKDAPENDPNTPSGPLWASRGDIDYRSQSNPGVGPINLPPQPTHNTGGAIPGWGNTAPAPQHMNSVPASFQSISTVLNQRPIAGKPPVESGNQIDQDMRKPPIGPQKIEVILPRPTAKDFFGTVDSESSDSMSQSPSHFESESTRQRIPGTFIAPSGNPNESQNKLRVVLPSWTNAMGQEKIASNVPAPSVTVASIQTPQDVDDRQNIYRKVGLPLPPPPPPATAAAANSNLRADDTNSSSKVMKISSVDSAHSQDPQLAAPDVTFYSAAPPQPPPPPPPHGSHLEHIVTSTTVVSSTSPQETRPVKSIAPTPPAAASPLPVITQELPSPGISIKKAPTYGTSNLPTSHLPPHSEFVPSTSHIQPVVDVAAPERLKPNPQWEGQQSPQTIPMPDHNPQPPPPPPPPSQHDPQKNKNSSSSNNSSGNPQSHNLAPSWPTQQDSPGQASILPPNEYYERKTYADSSTASSDPTVSSSPSSSVAGVSMDPHLGALPPPPLSSIRPPPISGPPPPPPPQPYPGSGPQLHRGGQFMGTHPQGGHGYHVTSRTDFHQGEQGPRTFGGPRHPFRPPGTNFQSGHGARMERGSGSGGGGGGASGHFPHQRQGSRFN